MRVYPKRGVCSAGENLQLPFKHHKSTTSFTARRTRPVASRAPAPTELHNLPHNNRNDIRRKCDIIISSSSHRFALYVDNTLKHFARVRQTFTDVRAAAEVTELQQTIRHRLPLRVDVRHQIVLTFRTQDDLGVVVEEVHL